MAHAASVRNTSMSLGTTVSESAKLHLGVCSTMYSIVSIVTKKVLGKYQGKSQCCMLLLTLV